MRIWIRKYSTDSWYLIPGLGADSTFKRLKTWAPNSGRALSGKSTGRVQYRKWKASVKCPMLTASEFSALRSFFDTPPDYFLVKAEEDIASSGSVPTTTHELTMYASDFEYGKQLLCGNNEAYYMGVSIELVEE